MKVLILAYDFPPLISIGGQRPYSWYKYLPENGISVTVVTRQWSDKVASPVDYVKPTNPVTQYETDTNGNRIIRAPFYPNIRDKILIRFGYSKLSWLRKILTYLYSFLEHLFFLFDSKSSIYREAEKTIQQNKPDVIIVTAEPFILFKYGSILSGKYNTPWIADYRDGWTTNQGNYKGGFLKSMLGGFYRAREKKYVSNTSFITTASPTYAEPLQSIHEDKEVRVIYNGFDEEYFKDAGDIKPFVEKFIVTYAGTIYPHQNLEMFLDGLLEFVTRENVRPEDMEVRFYGLESQPNAKERLLNYRKELKDFITIEPRVPYGELVKKMKESHILLLLSKKGTDWLNAKVFDYLAAKRNILLVENDSGILEKILSETKGGVGANNSSEVYTFLKLECEKYKSGQNMDIVPDAGFMKYSRRQQAIIFGQLLKQKIKVSGH